MNNKRYQIKRCWKRRANDHDDRAVWYRVIDTHIAAPDWDGNTLFESIEVSDCIDECNKLNEQAEAD